MTRVLLLLLIIISGCNTTKLLSRYTQQPIEQSNKLNNGMSKEEVISILGQPIKSDFYKNVDEWFYCKTGMGGDEHLALFFFDGKLIAKKNYVVTIQDVDGASGSCEWFIKRGSYREPDEVKQIRINYR
jgi:outer membrane protein assembly factor BamE (lipoprotein component of BamABCDE complex)